MKKLPLLVLVLVSLVFLSNFKKKPKERFKESLIEVSEEWVRENCGFTTLHVKPIYSVILALSNNCNLPRAIECARRSELLSEAVRCMQE